MRLEWLSSAYTSWQRDCWFGLLYFWIFLWKYCHSWGQKLHFPPLAGLVRLDLKFENLIFGFCRKPGLPPLLSCSGLWPGCKSWKGLAQADASWSKASSLAERASQEMRWDFVRLWPPGPATCSSTSPARAGLWQENCCCLGLVFVSTV